MATKEKLFKRGVGFTFTPSRVPDEGDVDYIDELNVLLEKSKLSQNKFLEVMLKDAIEYAKLKNAGSLPSISTPPQPPVVVVQTTSVAAEKPVSIVPGSENVHAATSPVETVSVGVVIPKDTVAAESSGAQNPSETPSVELDAVTRRAMERAHRAKLKQT